jgi:RNA polymerase sigma factor (sigma-70 family)
MVGGTRILRYPPGTVTDLELLERWRGGDKAAGEALFGRYFPAVTRFFANKVSGDPADLIQETFMACLHGRDRLADAERFRSYLFGIAYNVLRQYFRRQRVDGGRFDHEKTTTADVSPGTATMMANTAEQQLLLESLRNIPLQFQVVLELFYWEDMTSATIAEVLGEPHGTIRTRLRRARELLESAMRDHAADAGLLRRTLGDLDGWAAGVRAAHDQPGTKP